MVEMLLRPLAVGIALLAIYLWVLTRVAHGGKGWPRWRRKRRRAYTRAEQSRIGCGFPATDGAGQLCRVL